MAESGSAYHPSGPHSCWVSSHLPWVVVVVGYRTHNLLVGVAALGSFHNRHCLLRLAGSFDLVGYSFVADMAVAVDTVAGSFVEGAFGYIASVVVGHPVELLGSTDFLRTVA